MYGPLYYQRLDMEKTKALSQCGDFEGTMKLAPPVLEDIKWWIHNIHSACYVIDHGEPHVTLMPLQLGGAVNFRVLPQGVCGAQLRPNIT